jgi:hypothetical protein
MWTKYHVNLRNRNAEPKRKKRYLIVWLLIILALIFLSWLFYRHYVHSDTKIGKSTKTTTSYKSPSTPSIYQTYKDSDFSFQMSPGWTEELPRPANNLYNIYVWQNGTGANYETVSVYEDTIPTNFAVNHVIIVAANENKISVLSSPSDNCENFTNGQSTGTQNGYPAKWQGVAFNCDLTNTERDTVGISSAAAINTVSSYIKTIPFSRITQTSKRCLAASSCSEKYYI